MIKKLLIANRGEIALRIIRTCKELGIRTIAVYSDADRGAPHVMHADEAYPIGPPPSRESYLVGERIIGIGTKAGADAIHPGYGFLSENAVFAKAVVEAGLIFVGPGPEAIRSMGDKTEARRLVQRAGVPTVPGSDGPVASEGEARDFCELHGFPVLLKAAAGGGGKGMRIVRMMKDLPPSFSGARSEAGSAFGDNRVYIEKYLDNPRHIEFQILADQQGNIVHLGERECSIQRRHQKMVEESPSTFLDDELRARMGATAVMAARACGYVNAGTIEFLMDKERNFYFLEMNTRLQVEHPITELRSGVDIVASQISIAEGNPLPFTQEQIYLRGHAIECRICAEDPANGFLPSTGTISHLRPSLGPGVREDRGIDEGGEIPVYYDSMISKLIVWGASRPEAIRRMKRALREYEILGIRTNISACLFVMEHPMFVEGKYDTHFLQQFYHPGDVQSGVEKERIAAAAVCALLEWTSAGDVYKSAAGAEEAGPFRRAGWKSQRTDLMRS